MSTQPSDLFGDLSPEESDANIAMRASKLTLNRAEKVIKHWRDMASNPRYEGNDWLSGDCLNPLANREHDALWEQGDGAEVAAIVRHQVRASHELALLAIDDSIRRYINHDILDIARLVVEREIAKTFPADIAKCIDGINGCRESGIDTVNAVREANALVSDQKINGHLTEVEMQNYYNRIREAAMSPIPQTEITQEVFAMQSTEKFKPTEAMINAAETLLLAMAHAATIRPIVLKYETEIIAEGQWHMDRKLYESIELRHLNSPRSGADRIILDPKESYMMSEDDFKKYDAKCKIARDNAGLLVDHDEQCPMLVADHLVMQAEHALIETMSERTGTTKDQLLCAGMDKYKHYVDLTLRLLTPFVATPQQLSAAPAAPSKSYQGEIVAIVNDTRIIQHLGKNMHVSHMADKLDRALALHDKATVTYDDQGFGKVVPREKSQSKSQER